MRSKSGREREIRPMATVILATGPLATAKNNHTCNCHHRLPTSRPFPGSDCKLTPSLTRKATAFSMLLFLAEGVEGLRSTNGISALAGRTENTGTESQSKKSSLNVMFPFCPF